jgi:hypothetical protein
MFLARLNYHVYTVTPGLHPTVLCSATIGRRD